MAEQNETREVALIVEQAMADFRAGMEENTRFGVRIGRRTTQIIRAGMLSILILGGAMFYLITILTKEFSNIAGNMDSMAGNMISMEQNFQSVSTDLAKIESAIHVMTKTDLAALPAIDDSVKVISDEMGLLRSNFETVNNHMQALRGSVGNMNHSMGVMTGQLGELNAKMGVMAAQMNDISRPMRMFPF